MMLWWINLAGSTVGFSIGSLLLKRFADTNTPVLLLLSFVVLAASNVSFVQVIRTGLGQGIIASSMAQIILAAVIGVLVFGERFSGWQLIGVVFAIASIVLILGPSRVV